MAITAEEFSRLWAQKRQYRQRISVLRIAHTHGFRTRPALIIPSQRGLSRADQEHSYVQDATICHIASNLMRRGT